MIPPYDPIPKRFAVEWEPPAYGTRRFGAGVFETEVWDGFEWRSETVIEDGMFMTTQRHVSPHPKPTPHETELLIVAMEESVEVMEELAATCRAFNKRISKMLRFGADEVQPNQVETDRTNKQRLSVEAGELSYLIDRLTSEMLVDGVVAHRAYKAKRRKLDQFLQTRSETDAK